MIITIIILLFIVMNFDVHMWALSRSTLNWSICVITSKSEILHNLKLKSRMKSLSQRQMNFTRCKSRWNGYPPLNKEKVFFFIYFVFDCDLIRYKLGVGSVCASSSLCHFALCVLLLLCCFSFFFPSPSNDL